MNECKRPYWMPEGSIGAGFWAAQENKARAGFCIPQETYHAQEVARGAIADAEAMPAYEGSRSIKKIYSRSELEWFAEYILEYRWWMLLAETDMVVGVMSEDVLDFLSRHPRHEIRLLVAECFDATVEALGRLTQDRNDEVAEAALQALAERRNK